MRYSRRYLLKRAGTGAVLAGAGAIGIATAGRLRSPRPALAQRGGGNPSQSGQWQGPYSTPLVGIHAIVLPGTGNVLLMHGDHRGRGGLVYVWDVATMAFRQRQAPVNVFCSGHIALADGKALVAGGHLDVHRGLRDCLLFDPETEGWSTTEIMNFARWYPTLTSLHDGRILAVAGGDDGDPYFGQNYWPTTPEIYSGTSWESLNNVRRQMGADPYYPFMFLLPSGKLFYAGPHHIGDGASLDNVVFSPPTSTSNASWESLNISAPTTNLGEENIPAVTWLTPVIGADKHPTGAVRQRIFMSGGRQSAGAYWAQNLAWTIEFDSAGSVVGGWQSIAPMNYARVNHSAAMLPDGTLLVTGGSTYSDNKNAAVRAAELYDPRSDPGSWRVLASAQKPRLHHSTGFLLPDGRVAVTGTDRDQSLEIFSPPYLFKSDGTRRRPEERPGVGTVSAPLSRADITPALDTQVLLNVPVTPAAGSGGLGTTPRVAIIRPAAVTHSFDQDGRYVELPIMNLFSPTGSTELKVATPSKSVAPPGYYMLFVVDSQGVPSPARWVRLP